MKREEESLILAVLTTKLSYTFLGDKQRLLYSGYEHVTSIIQALTFLVPVLRRFILRQFCFQQIFTKSALARYKPLVLWQLVHHIGNTLIIEDMCHRRW